VTSLRVVWPIVNDAMFDHEALTEAWFDWPHHLREWRVEPVESPRIRVVDLADIRLDARQQEAFRSATRAVVCDAPVVKRTPRFGGAA
jgi:hypothetical protein